MNVKTVVKVAGVVIGAGVAVYGAIGCGAGIKKMIDRRRANLQKDVDSVKVILKKEQEAEDALKDLQTMNSKLDEAIENHRETVDEILDTIQKRREDFIERMEESSQEIEESLERINQKLDEMDTCEMDMCEPDEV